MIADGSGQGSEYRTAIKEAVADEETFFRLTASGKVRGEEVPWIKVIVRPVLVKGRRRMQFSYFDGQKDITKNFVDDEAKFKLDELLSLPFSHLYVQSGSGDLHVRITKKGKAFITRGKPSRGEQQPTLEHDHQKHYPLPAKAPDPFLQGLGIMTEAGQVRAAMQAKFRQVNQFLKLMEEVLRPEELAGRSIEIIDCGCGLAYLTFAAHHYLSNMRGIPTHIIGIDQNEEVIAKSRQLRAALGAEGVEFHVSRIADFSPKTPPDLVLSLHACDTATDEAIAKGILWGSRVILAAPCCQHEFYAQLGAPLFRPVLRHGILKQRLADILTDAFRALVLRIMGYRTDVVEFISPEYTSKNLMIRAVKALKPGDKAMIEEYKALKAFWQVEPSIEGLLREKLSPHLCNSPALFA